MYACEWSIRVIGMPTATWCRRSPFRHGFFGRIQPAQEGVEVLQGHTDAYVVVARRGHPRIGKRLSMAQYLAERHVVVKPWQEEKGVIDSALSKGGWTREIAIELPSVMAAPFIVANSDLLITLPRLAALQLEASAAIAIFKAPFEVPSYT
jgi:DNA-binding transcriptional LysR family regulator